MIEPILNLKLKMFVIFFKTSTNVLYFLTTVIKTPTAPTLKEHSYALVAMDILEMELCAKVNRSLEGLVDGNYRVEIYIHLFDHLT